MNWAQVAHSGNFDDLYELFQQDPYLLEQIDEVPFIDTPLHIAAAAGQVDFAVEMMNLKPSFATKLNPDGFTPMHIALHNHRDQLLFELLKINLELVLVKATKGMTLLQYAAEQGDADLVAKLLITCLQCITDVTISGKTVFHIAAERSKLEALQLLGHWLRRTYNKDGGLWELDVLNWKDKEGNPVLHTAASNIHNQVESGVQKNVINSNGSMALDILQQQSNANRAIILPSQAGGLNAYSISKPVPISDLLRLKVEFSVRLMVLITQTNLNIPGDRRNAFLALTGLVLTATYQAILNPPGGVLQADVGSDKIPNVAGRSVMGASSFLWFYIPNAASFLITLFLTVLFLTRAPKAELVLLPVVPLVICYVMSTVVITPTQKFSYFIWGSSTLETKRKEN
ncbi:ankyrin repeat-containing protein BDA1-like [Gossypium arboreum]|uniref:ankyrin repeat-containing protein BDA1-like n=1 Tax=Gossypium arboreum TaxID=29729 RepID=UPI000818F480|nr:ankyrin repeat-containing protein BDA1-like [Gossypium arboreum]